MNKPARTADVEITARAKFFTGQGVEQRKCLVEPDGTVRVWDDVAGHYTLRHALAPSAVKRIVRRANA